MLFLIFLFIFALTFHKCQIVMKAILSFFCFLDHFFVVFYFSFHLCFDLPQVSNCYESDSFIFLIFGPFFGCFFLFLFIFALTFHKCQIVMRTGGLLQRPEKLMTADGGLITGAGKAYDSGRGADYSGRRSL